MQSISFGHHQLNNRYRFEGVLKLKTALRVSSGVASLETDAPLIRTQDGIPYIPGSSLRGVIRSEVERIIAGLGDFEGLTSCTSFTKDDDPTTCISVNKALQDKIGEENEQTAFQEIEEKLCDVCKLFGSTVYASRLIIEDSLPKEPSSLGDKQIIRDGVGIDRDTGTARDGVKFDFEVLEKGPEFWFRMQVENVTDKDKKLLRLVLGLLRQGLQVGGKRTGGLGRIELAENDFSIQGFENPQVLLEAIIKGKNPCKDIDSGGWLPC